MSPPASPVFTVSRGSISSTSASSAASGQCSTPQPPQLHVAVTQVDRQPAAEHEEEVVGFVVLVPDERAVDAHDLQLVVVRKPTIPGW